MATISLCMIVRDEELVLRRCLDSVRDAVDEIIIVDTGSKDQTRDIALEFADHVYDFPWIDDFSAARNFAFSKASCDYQMWLDADDVVPAESLLRLIELKKNLTADVVMMPYHVAFDGEGHPTMTYDRERILKRECGFRWEGAVHEAITPAGSILRADIPIEHHKLHVNDPDRNLRIFRKRLLTQSFLSPREQYYYARELYYHEEFEDAAREFRAFLDTDGWIEDKISACVSLSHCESALGNRKNAYLSLLHSFLYDCPRAEVCCEIGQLLVDEGKFAQAVFWYENAISAPFSEQGFHSADYHDYIPYLQLCVCHDRLGNAQTANAYNERAGRIKPHDAAVLANRRYFRELL